MNLALCRPIGAEVGRQVGIGEGSAAQPPGQPLGKPEGQLPFGDVGPVGVACTSGRVCHSGTAFSIQCRVGIVQANAVRAFNALLAIPRPRAMSDSASAMAKDSPFPSANRPRCRQIHSRACCAVGRAGRLPMRGM